MEIDPTTTTKTTTPNYAKTLCNVSNDFEFLNISEEVIKKILLRLDTSKAAEMDEILEDKTKSILFSKTRCLGEINISYAGYSIKQHEIVEYLGC